MRRRLLTSVVLSAALVVLLCATAAAEKVTLYRDVWGVPHIFADSEPAAAYAYGYAQAQDRLVQIFRNYKQAEGSLAEVDGPDAVMGDFIARMMGHAEVCRAQYAQASPEFRAYVEAYQDGIRQYMKEHPEQVPAWAPTLEPWMATAVLRSIIFNWPIGEMLDELGQAGVGLPRLYSNEWAVSAKRSAEGCPILFIDPHISWDGMFRFHEARIHGGKDLNVSGFCPVGTPFVGLGHNDYVGWACTTGGPDTSDVFVETVDPDHPNRYRVDGEWRDFQVKHITFRVKTEQGMETVTKDIPVSRHGPVINIADGKAYALATPYIDQAGQLEMIARLNRAKSTDEVKQIAASNQWMAQNFMFAGRDGHIRYVRVGRVPIRPEGVDPGKPIPGDTSANDWRGIHPQSDLVQIDDPADGYMQNCNVTPTIMSKTQPVDPARFKPYLFNADTGRPWHSRGTRAVNLLDADADLTVEEALAIVNDTYVLGWEHVQPILAQAAKENQAGVESSAAPEAVKTLLEWDGRMQPDSVGAGLFYAWWQALPKACPEIDRGALLRGDAKPADAAQRCKLLTALEPAARGLHGTYGTWRVAWGEMNRVARGDRSAPLGGCATDGITTLRAVGGNWDADKMRIICEDGQSCTTLVFFKPKGAVSYSVTPWGESDDPKSPHYFDQAERLFSKQLLKPTWFQKASLLGNGGRNIESKTVLEYK